MRKVIAEIAISLDGFIEGPNGELDWFIFDDPVSYGSDFLQRFDTIFYGRVAYERFGLQLSPRSDSEAEKEFYVNISNMRRYVFSRSRKHLPGNGMVISGNIDREVLRIKDEEGKDIWLCGGADILKSFAELDLIDEYVFCVHPVVLGGGKPVFRNVNTRINLKLNDQDTRRNGIIHVKYTPQTRKMNRL